MRCSRLLPLVLLALNVALLAQSVPSSADTKIKNVKITGTASDGFADSFGDFNIHGQGLQLNQGWRDGPSVIGSCAVGTECTLSLTFPSTNHCCYGLYSGGSVGGVYAPYLETHLTFTASGFYSGEEALTMHVNVRGTVTGHQLVNCIDGIECDIGPALFTVRLTGHGTGEALFSPWMSGYDGVPVYGIGMSFTGVAHVEDIP